MPTFAAAADLVGGWARRVLHGGVTAALGYAGAVSNRLTADWILAPITSADQEVRADARTLRRRARELCRNDPYASRFLGLLEENVVGPRGIRFQSRIANPATGKQDSDANKAEESSWTRWCRPRSASVDGRLSFTDIQALAIRTVAQDGECFIRMVEGFDNPFGFALQFIDADQIDVTFDRAAREGQNEIRMGIEINEWGAPVAYHAWKYHPNDSYSARREDRERIPAREIIHLYSVRRPGQTRGVTWFAPVLMGMRMRYGLEEAELVASRTSASKMGLFVPEASETPDPNATIHGQRPRANMKAEPGSFGWMPVGAKDFKEWDPQHPNSAFEAFQRAILRSHAAGLRSSYHSMSGDLTGVSYSSIRDGTLKERDVYGTLHWWLIDQLHERVQPRQRAWAITTGQLEVDPRRRLKDQEAHEWIPRGFDWVDPLKEVLAFKESFALLIDSRTRAAASRGRDFDEVIDDRVRELQAMAAAGLVEEEPDSVAYRLDEEETRAAADALIASAERFRLATPSRNGHGH